MLTKIPLKLEGLDLLDDQVMDAIPEELHAALNFYAKGGVSVAVLVTAAEGTAASHEAAEYARQIAKLIPGAGVESVYDELVSLAQIAGRCGVATEAVRLWAAGKRRTSLRAFPQVKQVVPQGADRTMSLYRWADVLLWVREVLGLDPEEGVVYLSFAQVADLNAEIAHLERTIPERPWRVLHETKINSKIHLQSPHTWGAALAAPNKIFVSYKRSSTDVLSDIDVVLSNLGRDTRSGARR